MATKVVKVHFSMQRTKWLFQYSALATGERIMLSDLLVNSDAIPYDPTECHSTVCDGTVFSFVHFNMRITMGCLKRILSDIFTLTKNVPHAPELKLQHIPQQIDLSKIPTLGVLVAHAGGKNPDFVSRRKEGIKRSFFSVFCVDDECEDVQLVQTLKVRVAELESRVVELESRVAELEPEGVEQAEAILEHANSTLLAQQ
jgi:hypothetical protein